MTGIELVSAATMASAFGEGAVAITLGDAMMVGGTALGIGSALSSANAQAAGYRYNAEMADRQAEYERQKATVTAERLRERDRKLMGAQRARMGALGEDMTQGSPLAILEDTAASADTDYRTALVGGQIEANRLQAQGGINRMYGSSALTSGWLSAAGTAFTGAAKIGESRATRARLTELGGRRDSSAAYMGLYYP